MMGGFVFIFKLKGGGVTIIRTESIKQKKQRNVNVTKQCNNYNINEIITIERQTEPIRESDHHKKIWRIGCGWGGVVDIMLRNTLCI